MQLPWYRKPMRIAALQGRSDPFETLEVVDIWSEMGFNVEQGNHPIRETRRRFDLEKHGPALAAYLDRAHAEGVRFVLYLNVHTLSPAIREEHEDWLQKSRDQSYPKLYDTSYACCVNSPWRDHFFAVLDALEPYDIDGVFLDGPIVVAGGCYCASCQERYRREYGGELMEAQDTWEFYRRSKDDFLNEAYARFKAHKPEGVFYMNLPVMHPGASYVSLPDALAYNDIVGTEGGFMFYSSPKEHYLWKPSVAAKVLEAVAPEKPRVIFMAADQKPWGWYMHTAPETKLCIASTVANAASLWYGPHGSMQLLEAPGGRAAREIMQFLAAHEAYYEATTSGARVAVMYSLDTDRIYRKTGEITDLYGADEGRWGFWGNCTQAFQGFCDMLGRSGISYDIVTDLELSASKLARYDCVLLPTCACLSDGSLAAIREYVAAGGNIVASFDTSLYTPQGELRGDFGLSDVYGVSYGQGVMPYRNWNYFSLSVTHPLFEGLEIPLYPAPDVGMDVVAHEGADVLAELHGVMPGRYAPLPGPERPAIVWNAYGQGHSVYLAGTFAEMCASYNPLEYRRLLANAVGLFSPDSIKLAGGVGNVEVVVREQGERLLVHLVNYAAPVPRPFERVMPQRDLELHIPHGTHYLDVQALVAGCSCVQSWDGDTLVVKVPEMQEYEVIALA